MNYLEDGRLLTLKNVVCGLILLLYASSHFTFLTVPSLQHEYKDIVFPFLSKRSIYAVAGAFEFVVGLTCIIYRKDTRASITVWFFVATMVWYRTSIMFLGGEGGCNCLGILGRLLRVSKETEQAIPIVTLIALATLNLPWRKAIYRLGKIRAAILICTLCLLAVFNKYASAADGLLLEGTVKAMAYNPTKGGEYKFMRATSRFRSMVIGRTYDIEITNSDLKLWRIRFVYDGKTALLSMPSDGSYYRTLNPVAKERLAILSNEPIPKFPTYDVFGLCVLWMGLCLPTHVLAGDIANHTEIPLLWMNPRGSLVGYGYRWDLQEPGDKSTPISVRVVRNVAYDLDPSAEFLRLGLKTQNTVAETNELNIAFKVRRQQSQGFEIANFIATNLEDISGRAIPRSAELVIKLGEAPAYRHPWRIYSAEIENFTPIQNAEVVLPEISEDMIVQDFRFAATRNGKIYQSAVYQLSKGSTWPDVNDSHLLSERDNYFSTVFARSYVNDGHLVSWLALLIVFFVFAVVWIKIDTTEKKNRMQTRT